MTLVRVFLVLFFQFLLTGCFFNSTITSIAPLPSSSPSLPSLGKVSTFENVSGSTNYTRTVVSGYLVKQTAGLILNKQMASTPNGYRVYLNVSGRITSGEINQ